MKSDEIFSKKTYVCPGTCVDKRTPLKAACTLLVSNEPMELRKARFIWSLINNKVTPSLAARVIVQEGNPRTRRRHPIKECGRRRVTNPSLAHPLKPMAPHHMAESLYHRERKG
jgi:hypothetical protein